MFEISKCSNRIHLPYLAVHSVLNTVGQVGGR